MHKKRQKKKVLFSFDYFINLKNNEIQFIDLANWGYSISMSRD